MIRDRIVIPECSCFPKPGLARMGIPLALLDDHRRRQGRAFEALGLGPDQAPYRVLMKGLVFSLRAYHAPAAKGPPILIIPAPIKRGYLWDMAPEASAVRRFLKSGLRVFMIYWEDPGQDDQSLGLAEYADRFIQDGLDAIEAETGQSGAILAGHSLGGTQAAIFSALHPDRVRALLLIESPLHFDSQYGALESLVQGAPNARRVTSLLGSVPGSFLNLASCLASPLSFIYEPWADRWRSLTSPLAIRTHLRVVRWTLDELSMPCRLFEEIVDGLYREDRFYLGKLKIGGRTVDPRRIRAPILAVLNADSTIVPPQSVLPFLGLLKNVASHVLWYPGETGVALQHAGVLVGPAAHKDLWPKIVNWVRNHPP